MKHSISQTILLIFLVFPVLAQAQGTSPSRAFMGVRLEATGGGVRVAAVLPGSPASGAGITSGDVILRVDNRAVSTTSEVISIIGAGSIGDTVSVVIRRSGQERPVDVVLGSAPAPGQVMQSYVGQPAPAINLPRSDGGGQIALSGLRGQVVLVYFWSVWCGACRMATPTLERLQQDLGTTGLRIVGVSDDPLDRLRQSANANAMPFPILHDAGSKVGAAYWIEAVPSFFLVDQSGNVVFARQGWDATSGAALEQRIRQLLARTTP